jgi:hypothetical protein
MAWTIAHWELLTGIGALLITVLTMVGTAVWAVKSITFSVGMWVGTVNARLDGMDNRLSGVETGVDKVHERLDGHLESSLNRRAAARPT